ncbi:MAG: phenylacetate--CoA ligase family protein [Candidatus Nanohaloarchaea archaeon]
MDLRNSYYLRKSFKTLHYREEEIRSFRNRLVRELVSQAYEDFDFYRSFWDNEGFEPTLFETVDDLERIPIIDGQEVRDEIGEMESAMENSVEGSLLSSGSSRQERLNVSYDSQAWDWVEAIYLRNIMLQGYSLGKKQSYYWYEPFDQGIARKLVVPKERVPSDASLTEQLEYLEEQSADFIVYFPIVLFALAKKMLQSEEDHDITPEAIFAQGEILTQNMKRTINEAFEAPIYDNYGSTEFNRIAWECPEGEGYHVNWESVHLNIVDEEENPVDLGEPGELVGTSLVNQANPIIRYNLGDVVVEREKNCSCDTHGKVLKEVKGRKKNVVLSQSGEEIFPREIVELLADYQELLLFQFVQEGDDYLLKYVPNEDFEESILEKIESDFEELGINGIRFEEVDYIERTPGGKMPPVKVQR